MLTTYSPLTFHSLLTSLTEQERDVLQRRVSRLGASAASGGGGMASSEAEEQVVPYFLLAYLLTCLLTYLLTYLLTSPN